MTKSFECEGFTIVIYGPPEPNNEHGPAHVHVKKRYEDGVERLAQVNLVVSKSGSYGKLIAHTSEDIQGMPQEDAEKAARLVTRHFHKCAKLWRGVHKDTRLENFFIHEVLRESVNTPGKQ